ncbi:MAG TPA: hypothetical protein VF525_09160 [Pyrinomonadaceae bacterium]|jgi:hypothetical protein
MNKAPARRLRARLPQFVLSAFIIALCCHAAQAAAWHGLEPLKSRRGDVERELGKAFDDVPNANGALRFKVAGGTVTVTFVTAKFVATKKLNAAYEGTVLEIVLQHDSAADTPESMNLGKNGDFQRDAQGAVLVYRNLKDGIAYTFVNGHLRTTRYAPGAEQLAHAQVR